MIYRFINMFQTSFHLPHIRSVHVGEKRWQDSRKNSKKKKILSPLCWTSGYQSIESDSRRAGPADSTSVQLLYRKRKSSDNEWLVNKNQIVCLYRRNSYGHTHTHTGEKNESYWTWWTCRPIRGMQHSNTHTQKTRELYPVIINIV